MHHEIYLDNSATTPVSDQVALAMEPYWAIQYGNPSSPHMRGVAAEKTLRHCRQQISDLLRVHPYELYFTGSGTEANNIAIQGITSAPHFRKHPGHIITTAIEHPSVLNVMKHLETLGWAVTYLDVDKEGQIDLAQFKESLLPETKLVSVMMVNNELGSILPIEAVGEIIQEANTNRSSKIIFHVDAVQALGQIPINIPNSKADLMTFSGHKIFGPKGIGLLYARRGTNLHPILFGGNQEGGIRPGTENMPGIVGLTKAIQIAMKDLETNTKHLLELRAQLISGVNKIEHSYINSPEDGAPHILNIGFEDIRGEVLVHFLEQRRIFVSMGAACSSNRRGTSHVLKAIGMPSEKILGSIRISLAPNITKDQIRYVVSSLGDTVEQIRRIYM